MTARKRGAALPPADYRRPRAVDASGLIVRPVNQGGLSLGVYDFTDSPGPEQVRRELVAAFAARGLRHWGSEDTYHTRAKGLKTFIGWAAELDPPIASMAQFTVAHWKQWRRTGGVDRATVGVLLGEIGSLSEATRAAVTARIRRKKPAIKTGYSRAELKAIRSAAAKTVRTARLRIADNVTLLERWRAGAADLEDEDARWGELLDHMARTADAPRLPCGQMPDRVKKVIVKEGFGRAISRLFPTPTEMGAAAILLACHEAWNMSVLEKMEIPTYWPNADQDADEPAVHHVATDKPRRRGRRHNTNNLVNAGEGSAGQAMQQVLDMSAQARATLEQLGTPSTSLFLARRITPGAAKNPGLFTDGRGLDWAIRAWARQQEAGDPDFPAGVATSTVRHSVQVIHGGPRNNTETVHRDVYLMQDQGVRDDAADIVAEALSAAVAQARAQVQMRVIVEDDGSGDPDAQEIAERAGIGTETAQGVVSGLLDTPVAACTDFEHSPFTASGPCSVSFLLCFACPNALATGRHLPRIIYLHQALEAQRSVASASAWLQDWAGHHARVADLLDKHCPADARPALLATLSDHDRNLVDRMLERRLDP